jgi:AraC family transcriptional regulator
MRANKDVDVRAAADVYGHRLGAKFGADDVPFLTTQSQEGREVAVTEIRVERPLGRLCDPVSDHDAYLISLMLSDLPENSYWENGRQVSKYSLRAGDVTFHDLSRGPQAVIDKPFHSLLIHLPCAAFHALAERANVPRINALHYDPGVPVVDDTIRHIGFSFLPALRAPERANRLFTDHVMLALVAHTALAYGGMQTISRPVKGGLAPWQERRAKEMLAGDLAGTMRLHEIAEACGLSVSHFSHAFRRSTGLAPHAWLMQARVEAAKALLRRKNISVSSIAQASGFADQSHFTHAFRRRVGLSPSAWRKSTV